MKLWSPLQAANHGCSKSGEACEAEEAPRDKVYRTNRSIFHRATVSDNRVERCVHHVECGGYWQAESSAVLGLARYCGR